MKQVTAELLDINGEVLDTKILSLGDNDKLVLQLKQEVSNKLANEFFRKMATALEGDQYNLVGIPHWAELQVLKLNEK
ncbi:hypothetical protein CEW46_21465 [Bacillus cereus]|nr:hypothetical protein CEW46_21465 [Bacillus cereus]